MWPSRPSLFLLLIVSIVNISAEPCRAQQGEAERFELRGSVVNSVTGEAVAGALVQLYASTEKTVFSGADGSFVFTEVPRGSYRLVARKPGFFNEAELGRWIVRAASPVPVPQEGEATIKLTPEGVIYGEVTGQSGEPMENVLVQVLGWQLQDGRRQLQGIGGVTTNDQGEFRIAELRPGKYFLSFQLNTRWYGNRMRRDSTGEEDYGQQYYPGVPDLDSAGAINVRAGSAVHILQALNKERLFEISGRVNGVPAGGGFNVNLMTSFGAAAPRAEHLNSKTGMFQLQGVPEGTYLLTVNAYVPADGGAGQAQRPLIATTVIHANSDIRGLVLALGQGATVGVRLHDEVPLNEGSEGMQRIFLRMSSKEFPQNFYSLVFPPPKQNPQLPGQFEGLAPGTYTVEASANGPGYVAALQCGSLDLLREDLPVAAGAALPPIEVTLRNDGAELTVEAIKNGKSVAAIIVAYPEQYLRRPFIGGSTEGGAAGWGNMPPGEYKVIALDGGEELEFRSRKVMEDYLAHATDVVLQPGDKAKVRVEVQEVQEQPE